MIYIFISRISLRSILYVLRYITNIIYIYCVVQIIVYVSICLVFIIYTYLYIIYIFIICIHLYINISCIISITCVIHNCLCPPTYMSQSSASAFLTQISGIQLFFRLSTAMFPQVRPHQLESVQPWIHLSLSWASLHAGGSSHSKVQVVLEHQLSLCFLCSAGIWIFESLGVSPLCSLAC